VSDQASAAYIVRQQVQHRTRARRTVAYVGGAALETLRVGDLVAVTDSDVHLTRHLARVLTLGRGATPAVELELRDEGPQTSRRTS